jgi:hypothetical protein
VPDHIKLYLDEDVSSKALIQALRSRSVNVLTVTEAGHERASDEEQLNIATSLGRTILTFNRGEFVALHVRSIAAGKHHSGIIVAAQAPIGVLVRSLMKVIGTRSATDMHDWLEYLSNWR